MTSKRLRGLVLAAMLGALTAVMALINVPLPFTNIAFTMAFVGVFLSGGLLSPRYALLSQLVYLGLGVLGVPVFSKGQAGIGVLAGPTGGYLLAYPIMALVIALMIDRLALVMPFRVPAALVSSIVICYTLGTLWFAFLQRTSPFAVLTVTALPFVPFDLAKAAACTAVLLPLRKRLANPQREK